MVCSLYNEFGVLTMEYKLIRSALSDKIVQINKTVENEDGETNTDYQEYLKWVAKGNKAMEADEA